MAGTLLVTSMSNPYADDREQNTITLDWTSDAAAGNLTDIDICTTYRAAQAAINLNLPQPVKLKGYIRGIKTIPGANGDKSTNCPSDQYDITLDDPYDYDLAGGQLADRSNSVAQMRIPDTPVPVDCEVTPEISNAGNSKQGRIIIYMSPTP